MNLPIPLARIAEFWSSPTWKSRTAFFGLVWLAVLGALPLEPLLAVQARNVLFIVVDDLRTNLGCYGDPIARTPNVDRLAQRGMRFERAYCQYPLCNPSRSSFMTGLRPDTVKIFNNGDSWQDVVPEAVSLPRMYRSKGYRTAQVGKVFNDRSTGQDDPRAWEFSINPQGGPNAEKGEGRSMHSREWCRWVAAEGPDEEQPDAQTAAEGIRLLEQNRDRPFFIALGFKRPHDPFVAPKRYFDLYPLEQMPVHADPPGRHPDVRHALADPDRFASFTDRERREFLRSYYASTSFMDAQLGRVLDALDRLELWDSTVVVFFSDHGYHLGERGWWNKNTLFELSARAPLIVWAPSMAGAGRTTARLVEFVDLYPTLADLSGIEPPAGLPGRSFRALLDDPALPWKTAAYTQVRRGQIVGRSVRTERWRYTEWDGGRAGLELYDHGTDPGEWHNLANDRKYSRTVAELERLLGAEQQ